MDSLNENYKDLANAIVFRAALDYRDMISGLSKDDMRKVLCITNRKTAIKTACMLAQSGDAVLVAGKGHENYQEIQGVKHHFDDKEIINGIFNA